MQTQEGSWQNWHIPVTWNKIPSPPKSLWFPNLQDWGKKRRVKASSKWLGLSFILTRKNRNLQNCELQLCFLSLPVQKLHSTHSPSKSDKCSDTISVWLSNTPWFSSHSKPDWILHPFNLSRPSFSSFSPHPLTDLSYQILSCSTQLPALQLTDILSQEGTIRNRNKFLKTAKLHFKTLMVNSRFPS